MNANSVKTPLSKFIESSFSNAMSYKAFRELIQKLHDENKVTGPNQTEELLEYSKLNEHRMNRWDKHYHVSEELSNSIQSIKKSYTFLTITEGWCGDSAQIIPATEKMFALNPLFKSAYILRDEHLDVMDMFLTNGARSIPVVIIFNEAGEVVRQWGPRPQEAQNIVLDFKAKGLDPHDMKDAVHLWYARNKQVAVETEWKAIFEELAKH